MKQETYDLLEQWMYQCMLDSAHDREHVYRVLYTALDIAREEENVDMDVLIAACLLHDIGRHYIPIDLYNKVEKLSKEEVEEIRKHTVYALRAEKSVYFPFFPDEIMPHFRDVATMHHERYDGKGYPYGKKGSEIPFLARVCAIADAYDGMVSWKPYRDSLSKDEAVERLLAESGRQFQPELVECFVKCRKEIELIELVMTGE